MTFPFQHATAVKYAFVKPNGFAEDATYDGNTFRVIYGQTPKTDEIGNMIVGSNQLYLKTLKSEVDRLGITKRTTVTVGGLDYQITDVLMETVMGEVTIYIQET